MALLTEPHQALATECLPLIGQTYAGHWIMHFACADGVASGRHIHIRRGAPPQRCVGNAQRSRKAIVFSRTGRLSQWTAQQAPCHPFGREDNGLSPPNPNQTVPLLTRRCDVSGRSRSSSSSSTLSPATGTAARADTEKTGPRRLLTRPRSSAHQGLVHYGNSRRLTTMGRYICCITFVMNTYVYPCRSL